ncbi:peptide MFS transporter [Legionella spiritensis]|uniref:Proton/peptide symporter family protein n=1 Tax=Legionella spiritensis TaxID=452 RepID=A0A0W0Z8D6_LEGSP|nr:oligopeptide:H+ symporter [Legionella spiritensis]KTD65353.1 proton/peptide symporter family protein [Legionella spiritensis]SNV47338.1 proton/peptide symporter family protein [Legionella spiritensis]
MTKTMQRMPKGVTSLYFIQAFSTFSYAVLYSSLSLYITRQLGLSQTVSNSIVGLFLAFNYVLHLLGGVMGGRYLSNRVLFFVTTILQCFGVLLLAFAESGLLYIGLSLFLVGGGLNTTCYNSMLTQRFQADDSRREKAFFSSYAAMNAGFLSGFLISGFYDASSQYQQLFYGSVVTNIVSLALMVFNWRHLDDTNTPLQDIKNPGKRRFRYASGVIATLLLVPLLFLSFHSADISNGVVVLASIVMFGVIWLLGQKQKSRIDQQKIMAFLILAVTSIVFWMIYFTGPMGVTLFIKHNVDKRLFDYQLATQWLFNINGVIIIAGAPLMAMLIQKLRAKGMNFPVSMQFVWAFVILSFSFFCLSLGVMFADSQGYSSIYWVILYSVTQAMAELLIGPVGYAMIGRIAPVKLQGVLMGTWMMVSGVAASLSHYFSNAMVKTQSVDPLITNPDYLHVFNQLGLWAIAGAIFLYCIAGKIRSFMEDKAESDEQDMETVPAAS